LICIFSQNSVYFRQAHRVSCESCPSSQIPRSKWHPGIYQYHKSTFTQIVAFVPLHLCCSFPLYMCAWYTTIKESPMHSLLFLFLVLMIFASAFSFMVYRYEVKKRAREMRRNHYYGILQSRLSSPFKTRNAQLHREGFTSSTILSSKRCGSQLNVHRSTSRRTRTENL
jgi:hypothetical protein